MVLRNIKAENDLKGHVKVELGVGGERRAPFAQPEAKFLKLVEKHMTRVGVRDRFGPGFIHHFMETRHLDQKILKLEGSGSTRANLPGKKERAMVRERRREGVEDVVAAVNVPFVVAKDVVKLAQGWVCPPITPSEPAVLKVNLMELTEVKDFSEAVDSAATRRSLVLVSCSVNLIKVPSGDPMDTRRRLVGEKLREKRLLPVAFGWSIDGGKPERTFVVDERHSH